MPNVYTNLPQIWTPALCTLVADGIPITEIPQDGKIMLEKVDKDSMTISPLLYGGPMYNYTPGSRCLKLTFTVGEEASIRSMLETKIATFHQRRIDKQPFVVAAEAIMFSFSSPMCLLTETIGIPMVDPDQEVGKDRFNPSYEFVLHMGQDKLRKANAPLVITR